jgi:outer membrane protein OmpA-like peptidoglycan-associated protein
MSPRRVRPGETVTLTADADSDAHFTKERGTVTVAGKRASILYWNDDKIRFTAPAKATTGLVTINCSPLSGRVLTVLSPPVARVSAVPSPPGSNTYRLDARASSDKDGEILRYRWSAKPGLTPKGKQVATFSLPKREQSSTVKLVVSDDDLAASKPAQVVVSRVPASALFCFRCRSLSSAGRGTLAAYRKQAAGANFVLIEGHADFIGSDAFNLELSRDRARAVERYLVAGLSRQRPRLVRVHWYGERHPLDKRRTDAARARNRRVNVLISRSG